MTQIYRIMLFLLIGTTLFLSSCQDEIQSETQIEKQKDTPLTKTEIDNEIKEALKAGHVFDWEEQSDDLVYSAGELSDQFYSIGYRNNATFDPEKDMAVVNTESDDWQKARLVLEELIISLESTYRNEDLSMVQLLPFGQVKHFPQMMVFIQNPATIKELRNHELVRFVEPTGYEFDSDEIIERSNSGCDGNPDYSINSSDYSTVAPNSKVSWAFDEQSVQDAWEVSTGDNIKICIIDTGSSDEQNNLGSAFSQGYSQNRTLQRYSTLYTGSWWWRSLTSPDDNCGHGTSMAGLASAPRGTDGNSAGVAYNSDLMTIHAVEDVIISSSNEKAGVRDALYLAGGTNVDIISMSIGTPFYSSTVADGVYYAYATGKLMFAAAGTSTSFTSWYPVIFPATMSQTVACTGVKDQNHAQKCNTCHSGSQVVFTAVTERSVNSNRQSVALARYSNQPRYSGASSCATATTAGIAALVWAESPGDSRTQIINKLKAAAEYNGNTSSSLGWGVIDADLAVNEN